MKTKMGLCICSSQLCYNKGDLCYNIETGLCANPLFLRIGKLNFGYYKLYTSIEK